jgi:glycosyltransferase involved in cell wall biosynthesis
LAEKACLLRRNSEKGVALHQDAKNLIRKARFKEAAEALKNLDPEKGNSALLNDAAVVQSLIGNTDEALALLEVALKKPFSSVPPVLAGLNQLYISEVKKIRESFDFRLEQKNHDNLSAQADRPKVSVIVRTYERKSLLEQALQSLARQNFQDFEAIVVNDGGDKGLEHVVKSAGLKRARYFYAPHKGPWSAMNYGLEMARGEFITFLDDDDILYPEHLEVLVAYLERPGSLAVVYPDARISIWKPREDGAYQRVKVRESLTREFSREEFFRTNYISVLLMARRGCFEQVGRFCSAFPSGGDWEMWLRLSEQYPFHHLRRLTAEVRVFTETERVTSRQAYDKYHWDNLLLFMHRGLPLFSFSRRPEHERAYQSAILELDQILKVHPDLRPRINLRGLWDDRHPYAYFADQARWFLEVKSPDWARDFAHAAQKLRWFEPKPFLLMLRARINKG